MLCTYWRVRQRDTDRDRRRYRETERHIQKETDRHLELSSYISAS